MKKILICLFIIALLFQGISYAENTQKVWTIVEKYITEGHGATSLIFVFQDDNDNRDFIRYVFWRSVKNKLSFLVGDKVILIRNTWERITIKRAEK